MNVKDVKDRKPSATARAEAAVWVARLHGPKRTQEVEAGLRRWLADDPQHAAAFEFLTDTWEKSARLRRRPIEQVARWEHTGFRVSLTRAAAVTAVVAVVAILGTLYYMWSDDAVATGVGELRTLTLADGTRVHLNTRTRILVRYDKRFRQVRLESGEALFEVAKRPNWPFLVTADGRQIRALGTEFDVRRDTQNLVVTLVEGKVTVTPAALARPRTVNSDTSASAVSEERGRHHVKTSPVAGSSGQDIDTFTLSPGDRVTFSESGSAQIDHPPLDRITAWEHGQVILDNTSLGDAVAEMNRYSRQRIVVDDPAIAAIPISGIFEAGDSANFVQAVAKTYHLTIAGQSTETVVLTTADHEVGPRQPE